MELRDKLRFEHFLVAIEGPIGMVGRKLAGVIAALTKLVVPDAPSPIGGLAANANCLSR
jgi:hypothetical protein